MAVSLPTLVGKYPTVETGNVQSTTKNLTGSVPVGAVLYVTAHGGGSTTLGASDSKGHTWQSTTPVSQATAPASTTVVFWTVVTTAMSAADTITVTRSGNGGLGWSAAYVTGASGVTGTPVTATGTTATITVPNVPSGADSVVVCAVTTAAAATFEGTSGSVILDTTYPTGSNSNRAGASIYRESTDANPVSFTVTISNGYAWGAVAFEIQPSAVAPTPSGDFEVIEVVGGVVSVLEVVERAGGSTTVLELIEQATASTGAPLVGIYYGTPTSGLSPTTRTLSNFGTTPALVSGYIQQNESFDITTGAGQAKRDIYRAEIDNGAGLYITLASKDAATYSHNDFAAALPAAVAKMDEWIAFCSDLRAYAATAGVPFYTGWESEFEVKVNAGEITGVSNSTFAASHDLFCQRAKAFDPLLQTVYQVGHFDDTAIWEVLVAKQVAFDVFGLDPYRGNGSSQTTITQTINSKNLTPGEFRASAEFTKLGSPRVALTETGTHVPGYTDTNVRDWINSFPAAVDGLDLEFIIWFNSNSGPNNDSDLITASGGGSQNKPLAVAALAALLDKNNHA